MTPRLPDERVRGALEHFKHQVHSAHPYADYSSEQYKIYAAICSELLALRAQSEWRDIATAPRDGRFLGLLPDKRVVTIEPTQYCDYAPNGDGSHRVSGYRDGWSEICYDAHVPQRPTHWLPLPPAPRSE